MAGSTGTAGTGGAPGCPGCMLQVVAQCGDGTTTNAIVTHFKIFNPGNQQLNWSDVKVRYYYNADGTIPVIEFYYVANATWSNMKSLLITNPTAKYTELGFATGAGTLYALDTTAGSNEIQMAMHPGDYHAWNPSQTDDYSFSDPTNKCTGAAGTTYNPRTTMTAYVRGELVWGTEPP
jgi:hypothetical protein